MLNESTIVLAQPLSLNESPSEKEGKSRQGTQKGAGTSSLNESPSEKEGKCVSKG